jgi:hypothetical protein
MFYTAYGTYIENFTAMAGANAPSLEELYDFKEKANQILTEKEELKKQKKRI